MLYDIVHVDDNRYDRELVEYYATKEGLTYLNLSCLKALEDALQESSGQIFVVDGNFPRVNGGVIEQLAPNAIESIRSKYPDARVILYSSEVDIDGIAKNHNVDYRRKSDFTAGKLIVDLKTML